jgi:hypothetical protein
MRVRTVAIVGIWLGGLASPAVGQAPLIAFTDKGSSSVNADTVFITGCLVSLYVGGNSGHNDGRDLGASVALRGDTLDVRVGAFIASEFSPRDVGRSDWTLHVGALPFRRLFLRIFLGAGAEPPRLARWIDLGGHGSVCPA